MRAGHAEFGHMVQHGDGNVRLRPLCFHAPRPQTAYYAEVSSSIQRVYHPTSSVEPGETGEEAAELIIAVLNKEELL